MSMEFGGQTEPLTLANLCGGELAADFEAKVKEILAGTKAGQKGTVSISIEVQRTPNTQTMLDISYSIKHTLPAKKKGSVCVINGANNVLTEPVRVQRPKVVGEGMFPVQK